MKNDYYKSQFWVKEINDEKIYYIKIENQMVEVTKEIYIVCKNSYQKMNYEINKDLENPRYSNINYIHLYGKFYEYDYINELYVKDIKKILYRELKELSENEIYIINSIYFFDMKEAEVAKQLGISQQSLNYRKKRILKKIRKILLKQI